MGWADLVGVLYYRELQLERCWITNNDGRSRVHYLNELIKYRSNSDIVG